VNRSRAALIPGVVLDHVAHAVPRWQDVWERYAVDLGARWSSGGESIGFAPAQLRFGNEARIELLMPHDAEKNDFLRRFLARQGAGPHHLTFKVPNLAAALEESERFGIEPINVDMSDPMWLEAFLHPRQATGIVVQLAEAPSSWDNPAPSDFPTEVRRRSDGSGPIAAADLDLVAHAVADLESATDLFGGLLGGVTVRDGTGPDYRFVDLTWGGPLVLRLLTPTDPSAPSELAGWLGDRAGRLHHLAVAVDEPFAVSGAHPASQELARLADGAEGLARWELAPSDNLGLRLLLAPSRPGPTDPARDRRPARPH
jgi:catechol 2,3-dioxygenase-like lactoylglutathione lyase family enzyme